MPLSFTPMIDSHAHLDYEYDVSTAELVQSASANGIDTIIAITAEPSSLDRVPQIANTFANVFHTAGIHPHEAIDFNDEIFAKVKELASSPKCVAIGELGLDYYYDHSPRDVQIEVLRKQLAYAVEVKKPVVVHTRDAEADTISELTAFAKQWQASHGNISPGVIHCFTSSKELAEATLALGFYISLSGVITFKNADTLRATVSSSIPLERILVETDSPYLAPVPHRGKKNKPEYTRVVAEKVAELKNVPLQTVAETTRKNTIALFNLPVLTDVTA